MHEKQWVLPEISASHITIPKTSQRQKNREQTKHQKLHGKLERSNWEEE